MTIQVIHNETANRFQAEVDGHLAVIDYRRKGHILVLTHTGVPDELGGRGVGSTLVKAALDHAVKAGLKIVPECPFVAGYIDKHPEYRKLVATG